MYVPDPTKRNKLPAFTVAELVVVAALSVITVSLGFAALDLIDRQVGDYDREGKEALIYSDLTRLLNRDFLLSREVRLRERETWEMNYDSLQVRYELRDAFLLRSASLAGSRVDTFYLQVTDFSATFGGNVVRVGWIDQLQLGTVINGIPYEMTFAKTYAAEDWYRRASENL